MSTVRLVSAALVMTILGGCALLPRDDGATNTTNVDLQVADEIRAHVDVLSELAGVTARYAAGADFATHGSIAHAVIIDASQASTTDLVWAIVTSWRALTEPLALSQSALLKVEAGERGEFILARELGSGSDLSERQLTDEVEYWLDFGSIAGGAVYDEIVLADPGYGYLRSITSDDCQAGADFDQLRTVPDVSNGATHAHFRVCGISSETVIAPASELEYGARVQALRTASPSGTDVYVDITQNASGQSYVFVHVWLRGGDPDAPDSHERWPFVEDVAETLAALPNDQWGALVQLSPSMSSNLELAVVSFGLCESPVAASDYDNAFFELLEPADLPEGSRAGACFLN